MLKGTFSFNTKEQKSIHFLVQKDVTFLWQNFAGFVFSPIWVLKRKFLLFQAALIFVPKYVKKRWLFYLGSSLMYNRFKKIAWIQSHDLHLQWEFKFLVGKFTWGKAKHCWVMSTNLLFTKVCWQFPAMFCLYSSSKLYHHNLNFHWS